MNIEVVSIDDLIQDDHNFNKGHEQGAQVLERSFREGGAGRSVLIDKDNRLVGGNKAQKGFKAAGKKKVIIVDSDADPLVAVRRKDVSLDSAEGRKMAYLDNLTTQVNLTWDQTELEAVQSDVEGFDVSDFGFDIEDLPQVTLPTGEKQGEGEGKPQTEVKEDDFDPDAHYETKVKAGEVWQLGEHRLMCGDSTKAENFEKLMGGERADMCFTSPPYNNAGNAIETGNFRKGAKSQKLYGEQGYTDDRESNDYIKLCRDVLDNMFKFTDGYIFWNVNYNANARSEYIRQVIDKLDYLSDLICWKKRMAITNTAGGLTRIWEPIYVFSTDKKPLKVNCILNNHWEVDNVNASYENHRACFPVALPGKAIQCVAKEVNIVLEPFGGSGSTLIACEQLGRKCRIMELDPHYCNVIIARWEKLTGQKAIKLNP